jgi:hypothetical protein
MLSLLSDQYAPITTEIGYIRAPLDQAATELVTWRAELGRQVATTPVVEPFPQNLYRLEPLLTGAYPRELLIATDSEWVAYFACGARGSDPMTLCQMLTRRRGWDAATITCEPHTIGRLEQPGRWGGVQFALFGPQAENGHVRTISTVNDSGKWRFDAIGAPQGFERLDAYKTKRVRERFTSTMLNDYCNALGIRPFDPDFYTGPAVLLEEPNVALPANPTFYTLRQAQQLVGIQPGLADTLPG